MPQEVLLAHVDAVLVEQVIVNLLDNACRYTPSGTPIEIDGWMDRRRTVLEVPTMDQGWRLAKNNACSNAFNGATT